MTGINKMKINIPKKKLKKLIRHLFLIQTVWIAHISYIDRA